IAEGVSTLADAGLGEVSTAAGGGERGPRPGGRVPGGGPPPGERVPGQPPPAPPPPHDALVIGGGPAGSAAGHCLARAGHDVVVVEKKTFPREKTCGDGLTPRAVTQLRAMGLEEKIAANHHRYEGLRCIAHGITLEMPWPQHPVHPSHGYVVRRRDLDTLVAEEAAARGATLLQGTEALRPIL